ncbi:MAG: Arginine/ornithine antiporter ArcD [Pseudolabrys sp.]|nr:Arginine/ornithine antiporter ArcD [Pseudolabrys sp.]
MTDPADLRRQRLTGIALMCAAVASFSCLDTTGKYLNHHMSTMEVVWTRYFFAFVLTLFISNPVRQRGLIRTKRPWLQVGRSALLLLSTILNLFALRTLQLDETLAITFSTPLMVALLSVPLLGETVGWRRWTAITVGFFGVLVVTRPGVGNMPPAALLSMCSAVCYAFYVISTRILSRSDSSETTQFYTNLVGALAMTAIVPFYWSRPDDVFIAGLMILIGALGAGGHYLLIRGHRLAPASTLAPFIYTQMIWSATLGFIVFGDIPHRWTIIGGTIVIESGLYLLHRETVRNAGPSTPVA